jgi:PAS domain S-box-containing protein
MYNSPFLGLMQNALLLLAVAFIFDMASNRRRIEQSLLRQTYCGLALGVIGVTIMLTPWTFGPGIVFDTRSVLFGISGLFFGIIATAIAMAITTMFRFYQGGTGAWTGVAVILTSGAIGIAWRYLRRRPLIEISWSELYPFGVVIHLAMLGLMLTLPWATALRVLSNIALPVVLIYPLGTALLGTFMVNRLRREQTEEALHASEAQLSNALEMAHLGHWEYDIAKNLFTFNDQFYNIFRTTVEKVGGYTMHSAEYAQRFVHPDDLDVVGEEIRKSIETTDPHLNQQIEHRILYADGTVGYITVRIFIVKDSHGRTIKTYGVNQDITERKHAEEQLKNTLDSLRKSFGATIQVMVSAVETRDPYTAGHQLRSADLARAMATEMGLPQEKIDGIRMAGSIHDIGKLSVPAEILSKPTKLTDIEFSLIKEHSRKGYEMLKNVESPWPLAQIVYQHHERMDGSGYPRNLQGDDILIEARILAVSDVVESMASHRPYRPALGLNAALEEIEKNRGSLYDKVVVDACLRLFREKGFQFEGS